MPTTSYYSLCDIDHAYLLTKNWCDRHFPQVLFKQLDINEANVDDYHDEIVSVDKRFTYQFLLRAFISPAEQVFPLSVFAIEELRDVILQVSVPNLLESALATQDPTTKKVTLLAKVGDRFNWSDADYDCLVWKRGPGFGNTDIPQYYFCSAEKVRRDAYTYE